MRSGGWEGTQVQPKELVSHSSSNLGAILNCSTVCMNLDVLPVTDFGEVFFPLNFA